MGRSTHGIRACLDVTATLRQEASGVAHYVRCLIDGLAAVANEDDRFVLAARLSRWKHRERRPVPPDARFKTRWMQEPWRPRGQDVAHGPDARLLEAGRAARVVTIHDLFPLEKGAEGTPAWLERMRRRYQQVADRADIVICPSTWTRDRFLAHHRDFDAARIRIVPHGVESRFRPEAVEALPAVRRRLGIEGDYALFLGALVARKNPGVLIDTWARLPRSTPRLVFAGSFAGRVDEERERASRLGVADRVTFTGHLETPEVPALLAGARCLLLPSRMEGFGLPALEALACGTPVVHSGRAALPEATGGHHVEVDPDDVESVAVGVRRVLEDAALRRQLQSDGLAYAEGRTWRAAAAATLDAYREAAAR